jgi:uncharacterized membrane protein YccC
MQEHASDNQPIQASLRSWLDALKLFWSSVWRIDRSQLTAQTAIRGLIGFVLPLALGVATGYVAVGAAIAGGAILFAVVGLNNTNRVRLRTLFFSCVAIAIGAFIGSVTSDMPLLSILAVGVLAFGAGLLVAISVPTSVVGMQPVLAVIVLTHFALDPLHALIQAALIFAGALLELFLEVLFTPWHHTDAERKSLSLVYERLAERAIPTDEDVESSKGALRAALTQSQTILLDSNNNSLQGRAFFALYDEAEQMRLILIVLRQLRRSLLEKSSAQKENLIYLDQLQQELSIELRRISKQLLGGRALRKGRRGNQSNENIRTILAKVKQWQGSSSEQQEILQGILAYCNRMVDLLYRIKRLAWTWRDPDTKILAEYTIHRRFAWVELHNVQEILNANLTFRSTAFRHAIRLGVTLALATAIYHIPAFPIGRGYWIPLTACLVLKPDFNTTFTRGASRMLGTLGGVILSTLLVTTLKPTLGILVAIDAIAAYIAFSTLFANYAIYSAFITVAVVILLAFVTPQPLTNVFDRGVDTLLGGLLALLMFLIWPTWERSQVYQNLATRLEALRRYFVAVMEAYIYPSTYNPGFMNHIHLDTRLAHSNVVASIERVIQEPSSPHFKSVQARGLMVALDSMGLSILTLEAYRVNNFVLPSALHYHFSLFTKEIDKALQQLARAIRDRQSVTIASDDIQAALSTLVEDKKDRQAEQSSQGSVPIEQHLLIAEAAQIVRNIDIISKLLPVPEQESSVA